MSHVPKLRLNDGRSLPQLGLGVWQIPDAEAGCVVREAINAGYRSIDTAAIYANEHGTGEGIRSSGLAREELYVTTKLWNDSHGYDRTLQAFDRSLARLGLDYVDLYLMHWPVPALNLYVDSWKAMLRLRAEGRARSIGVSNFNPRHLQELIEVTGIVPAVNQIELHPRFQQKAVQAFNTRRGIVTESWSPLGQGTSLGNTVIQSIAAKHGRTPAQIILRWHLELGFMVIPKSRQAARLKENLAVFDFALSPGDLLAIGRLDTADGRIGGDPELEA